MDNGAADGRTQEKWDHLTRNRGRLRLTEPQAGELHAILCDELDRRLDLYFAARRGGEPPDEVSRLKYRARLIEQMRNQTYQLMEDKGWLG